MNKAFTIVIFSIIGLAAQAQGLLPTITSGVLPADSDPICSTPWYSGIDFDTAGYDVGQTVNDFTLFDINGTPFNLATSLSSGKPVLMVTGSITCPVFRNRISTINSVYNTYLANVTTIIVYAIEAHPTDTSPYFGNINIPVQNTTEGILYPQPTTYGERKMLVDSTLQYATIDAPIYIDDPCNEWWNYYGPAPQNAYLIDTNGVVMVKHGWFDKFPQDIFCDIDSALGLSSGMCSSGGSGGTFLFELIEDSVYGNPGEILYGTGNIINNSAQDVQVIVMKLTENYAPGWDASFCMDICYANSVDSTVVLIPPMDTLFFSIDFHTNALEDSSSVRVGFRNLSQPTNQFTQWFFGSTFAQLSSLNDLQDYNWTVYPNPFADNIYVNLESEVAYLELQVVDMNGRIVAASTYQNVSSFTTDLSNLAPGMYSLNLLFEEKVISRRVIRK